MKGIRGINLPVSHGNLAIPETVAKALIEHTLNYRETGKTLLIQPGGLIELLEYTAHHC